MEHLLQEAVLPYLRQRFHLSGVIKTRVLHTAGVGESQIDERIGDLETLSNPTVGLAAHSGQVDVRITAKAGSEAEADPMIAEVEATLRQRLGDWVYGADQEALEQMALDHLGARGWGLAVVEAGLGGELVRRLANARGNYAGGLVLAPMSDTQQLLATTQDFCRARQAEVGLGVTIIPGRERQEVHIALHSPLGDQHHRRPFGGPPAYAPRWAAHHGLDLLRKL
jgi:hypothetical protein